MTITSTARNRVWERDVHRCAACGTGRDLTLQHRRNKGMGGSQLLDGFDNLLTLCWGCNLALESDASFAETGRRNGWKLSAGQHASDTPIYVVWAREWRLIDTAGDYTLAI